MTEARAAVVRQYGAAFVVESIEVSAPRAGEVVVAITASGICHTDLLVNAGFKGVPLPVVLGHEGCGVVEEVGPGVTDVRVGDAVIIGFPHCGGCVHCSQGRPYICEDFDVRWHRCTRVDGSTAFSDPTGSQVHGFFGGQSSLTTHTIVEARHVVRVDAAVDPWLLAPLACGVSTGAGAVINGLRPRSGTSMAVYGLGAVGLSSVMAAHLVGCRPIVAVDKIAARLDLALAVGATHVFDANDDEVVRQVREVCRKGAEFAVEAAGHPQAVVNAVGSLAMGGEAVFLGNQPEGTKFEVPPDLLEWNQSLRGSNLGDSVPRVFIPTLVQLVQDGRLPVADLVTRYDFDDVERAANDLSSGTVIKPVVVVP